MVEREPTGGEHNAQAVSPGSSEDHSLVDLAMQNIVGSVSSGEEQRAEAERASVRNRE